jgi:hypothetical protein
MGKKVTIDVTEIGRKGGQARIANMTAAELSKASSKASNARWEEYYRLNPQKLEERKRREAASAAARKRKGGRGKGG